MQAHAPEWYVISLRPHGAHAGIADAASRHGAGVIRLSPWKLVANEDPAAQAALAQALACEATVFTSPAAARFAAAWKGTLPCSCPIAVGAGTLEMLRRAGLVDAQAPARMDSEGVLALPVLQQARRIGLVTAPGGRELIATALMARGKEVVRADVYRRVPMPISASVGRRLAHLAGTPACLLASSAQALQQVLGALSTDQRMQLKALPLIASSDRVAEQARALGFVHHRIAEGPRPAQLLEAASHWHSQRFR
jgi:uroporphyrinogen-III synthase